MCIDKVVRIFNHNYLTNLKEHSKDSDGLLVILLVLVEVVPVVDQVHLHREPATI